MALSRREIDARNAQIQAAQNAIRAGNASQAQAIVNNLIGGSKIGGAQAALQGAINVMPAPAPSPTRIPSEIKIIPATGTIDSGGGGGGGAPPPPPAPRAAPAPKPPPPPKIVKSPNRDVVEFSREQFSQSSIARLLFEQVGSIELVNISRRDTIEGQNPYYTLISNLSSIRKNFDPTSLISRQKSNQNISDNYSISLNNKIPDQQYLDRNNLTSFYYIDSNGDLVIELDNLAVDEIIDLEIASSGTINLVDEA